MGEWNWRGVDPDTSREVFSVTKSITSTLVGLAQSDGDLDIGDSASTYIEEWRGTRSRAVTIRDLLSNVSGRFWEFGSDYGNLPQAEDRTQYRPSTASSRRRRARPPATSRRSACSGLLAWRTPR